MTTKKTTVASKVHAVMKSVGYLKKDGKNNFQNYNYLSEAKVKEVFQEHMIKEGLIMYPSNITMVDTREVKDKIHASYVFEYTIMDIETEDYIKVFAVGSGVDNGDKYAYKAAAGALKYALTQTHLVPTGDDPEVPREDEKPEVKKPVFTISDHQDAGGYIPDSVETKGKHASQNASIPSQNCPSCSNAMTFKDAGEYKGKKFPAHFVCASCNIKQAA